MAKKTKFGIQFEGFDELIEQYDKLDGDLKGVVTGCLVAARQTISPRLKADMKRHRRTGNTERSIIDKSLPKWEGSTASIDVGFDLKNGGMPSIFLMYGTPRMPKDTKLYNDIYGAAVKKEIKKKQEEILQNAIRRRLGG